MRLASMSCRCLGGEEEVTVLFYSLLRVYLHGVVTAQDGVTVSGGDCGVATLSLGVELS